MNYPWDRAPALRIAHVGLANPARHPCSGGHDFQREVPRDSIQARGPHLSFGRASMTGLGEAI